MTTAISNYQAYLALTQTIVSYGIYPTGDTGATNTCIGTIHTWAFAHPGDGTIATDGAVLSIGGNNALHAIIHDLYGGNGTSTMAVPNLVGRTLIDDGTATWGTTYLEAAVAGTSSFTLTQQQLPASLGGTAQPIDNLQPSQPIHYGIVAHGDLVQAGDEATTSAFVGQIVAFAGTFSGSDVLDCDGRLLNIADYFELYAVIGKTYGGDGATTFALPDLRGRAIIGADDAVSLGDEIGSATTTLTTAQLPTSLGGSGAAVDNRQPSIALTYMIATSGLYPDRYAGAMTDAIYIGEIYTTAATSVPDNMVVCDGRLLNIAEYPALYSLIGTIYGGNGSTTFAVPDLRERTIVGAGTGFTLGTTNTQSSYLLTTGQLDVDSLIGTSGADVLVGTSAADHIYGLAGNDTITGGGGADQIQAGDGDDSIVTTAADSPSGEVIDGGAGTDTLYVDGGGAANLQACILTSIERIVTRAGDATALTLAASQIPATLDMRGSADTLRITGSWTWSNTALAALGATAETIAWTSDGDAHVATASVGGGWTITATDGGTADLWSRRVSHVTTDGVVVSRSTEFDDGDRIDETFDASTGRLVSSTWYDVADDAPEASVATWYAADGTTVDHVITTSDAGIVDWQGSDAAETLSADGIGHLRAGGGDDIVTITDAGTVGTLIDGAGGYDRLDVTHSAALGPTTVDLAGVTLAGIEEIRMIDAADRGLTLRVSEAAAALLTGAPGAADTVVLTNWALDIGVISALFDVGVETVQVDDVDRIRVMTRDTAGVITSVEHDTVGGAWDTAIRTWDSTGSVTGVHATYDDGTVGDQIFTAGIRTALVQTDPNNAVDWRSITTHYDDTGNRIDRTKVADDGTITVQTWTAGTLSTTSCTDPDDNRSWRTIDTVYDAAGRMVSRTWVADTTETTTITYDTAGRPLEKLRTDVPDLADWSTAVTRYDTAGQVVGTTVVADDGTSITRTYVAGVRRTEVRSDLADTASWETVTYEYDATGDLTLRTIVGDDTTVTDQYWVAGHVAEQVRSDENDVAIWDTISTVFDTSGAKLLVTTVRDDGRRGVVGGIGGQTLIGGGLNDVLTGGADADVFVAGPGRDLITDFVDGVDLLDLTGIGFGSMADFTGAGGTLTHKGSDLILTLGSDTLTLASFGGATFDDADLVH